MFRNGPVSATDYFLPGITAILKELNCSVRWYGFVPVAEYNGKYEELDIDLFDEILKDGTGPAYGRLIKYAKELAERLKTGVWHNRKTISRRN